MRAMVKTARQRAVANKEVFMLAVEFVRKRKKKNSR
jgi:hypothetical protein